MIVRSEEEMMYCGNCGAMISGKPNFCPYCGKAIEYRDVNEEQIDQKTVKKSKGVSPVRSILLSLALVSILIAGGVLYAGGIFDKGLSFGFGTVRKDPIIGIWENDTAQCIFYEDGKLKYYDVFQRNVYEGSWKNVNGAYMFKIQYYGRTLEWNASLHDGLIRFEDGSYLSRIDDVAF